MVSIIIRTKNEERWIGHCLKAIFSQDYKNFEVIIVDNESTDKTINKAKKYPVKVVNITNYTHGKALNKGIKNSKGDLLVFLSGHCIPYDNNWLKNLIIDFDNEKVAGVYGRQLPMNFSSAITKRDLLITFGLDKKIQKNESFFHNANSAIRRTVWDKVKFDEDVSNIEDRLWASEVLKLNFEIVYTPEASVYHYHGIHHDNNITRVRNTINIIENHGIIDEGSINIDDLLIICIIPVKKSLIEKFDNPSILKYTLEYSKKFDFIHDTIVLTDSEDISAYAKQYGAKVPLLREKSDSQELIDLQMVYKKYYSEIENKLGIQPDLIVSLEPTYIFRPDNLIEEMLKLLISDGYDTVIPIIKDYNWMWIQKNEQIDRIDSDMPRHLKDPVICSLKGLGCLTHPEFIRKGKILGHKIGMVEVDKIYDQFEIRKKQDIKILAEILKQDAMHHNG